MSERRLQILEAATRTIARSGVRGLRVEEIAAAAGVSTGLIYYHFGGRAELLRRTLDFIGERAERCTAPDPETVRTAGPRARLEEMLLRELQDTPELVENSTAWGEFQSSAVFDPGLREQLREATRQWTDDVADLVREAQAAGTADRNVPVADAAERLTALVEGLSTRWLSGSVPLERARELLRGGIERELGPAAETD
ncbi:TetR/AcrR family transcriptional regulator [Streptomyces chrestomyceticus]|uniref:TetR/AcrR family transcriptional regulator n=1 Tax=Streptomyces chrestomyceticus TaxID=68185 RepID=UPI00367C69C6